jgi:dTDP-4-dehydrorhamnose 3,5-epimerase
MDVQTTDIPGVKVIVPRIFQDERGTFIKTFHEPAFADHGLATHFAEQYYSVSGRNVIRGMHFQTPPHDHAKLVYCAAGRVLDVIVDLRVGSPMFQKAIGVPLDAVGGHMVHIPRGCAHGFAALTDGAAMFYNVATPYAADHDAGIRWDSVGFDWPVDGVVVVSKRDMSFPAMRDFRSPFVFA